MLPCLTLIPFNNYIKLLSCFGFHVFISFFYVKLQALQQEWQWWVNISFIYSSTGLQTGGQMTQASKVLQYCKGIQQSSSLAVEKLNVYVMVLFIALKYQLLALYLKSWVSLFKLAPFHVLLQHTQVCSYSIVFFVGKQNFPFNSFTLLFSCHWMKKNVVHNQPSTLPL